MKDLPQELREAFEYDLDQCPDLELDKGLINVSDVLKAHYILANYFSDDSSGKMLEKMLVGVRSYDLLASAVGRQGVGFEGRRKYSEKISLCATLFYGLVKNHAFHDGNKRTALLVLIYQLTEYGYFPQPKNGFTDFEKLDIAIADNKLEQKYGYVWKKFKDSDDCEIKTIEYLLRRMTQKKDTSFHMNITTKEFCKMLENIGVKCTLIGQKIKLERHTRPFFGKKLQYSINFYGWTRPVQKKMARDIEEKLELKDEFCSISSWAEPDSNLYKIIGDFEEPLIRLKDK